MPVQERTLHQSQSGDRWSLAHDPASGALFVRHQGNAASGGHRSDMALGEFLGQSGLGPEKQALLRLIAGLVVAQDDESPASQATATVGSFDVASLTAGQEGSLAGDVLFALREVEMLFGSLARQFGRAGMEHAPDDLKRAAREMANVQERIAARMRPEIASSLVKEEG